ncbi:hypothetical protein [Brevibacillus laterosporus]|uniref:hypothetical protein n=1 Tax=Brevibacillus laterosporus TaxID=1465 RepID=UPI003D262633
MLKQVTVDTLLLVAKLTQAEVEEVYDTIAFTQWNGNKSWKHAFIIKRKVTTCFLNQE